MSGNSVNIYEREKLYSEVWNTPVIEVAKQYGVSNVAIKKKCKAMNIPTPPPGYWAKLRSGKDVKKEPLPPPQNGPVIRYGLRPNSNKSKSSPLSFLSLEEQDKLYSIASSLTLDPNERPCKEVLNYQKVVIKWNKNNSSILGLSYSYSEFMRSRRKYVNDRWVDIPVLAGLVSNDSLIRINKILNCINNATNQLGYFINDDLSFSIRGERVEFVFYENQESIEHIITEEEQKKLRQYEDHVKRFGYGEKPYIPSTDYRFNGYLSFTTKKFTYIKDTDENRIEDRIGDMLIQLVQQSEIVKAERLTREEEQRKRDEEENRRELHKKLYNDEVDKLTALLKEANDFELATKIRDYAYYVQQMDIRHKNTKWIAWAKEKADWYDPFINKRDSLFGARVHNNDPIPKNIK